MTLTSSTRGWVLAVLALLAAGANMPSPLYSAYQQQFGFSDLTLTAVYAVYAVVSIPALVLLGPLGDRLRPRLVLRAGVLLAAAGSLCLALATSLPWLVAGRVAYGVALGAVTGLGMALVARLPGRRGAAATAGSVAFLLGSAAGPAITGALAQYGPAPFVLPFVGHLALLALLFAGLGTVREEPARPVRALSAPAPLTPGTRRALLVAAANGSLSWTVTGLFLVLVPAAVERALGVHDLALAGGVAGAVVAWSTVTPAVLRRLGTRRAQVVGLVAMIAPLLVLASGVRDLGAVLVACTVAGLAHGLLFGGAADLVGAATPPDRGGALTSWVNAAFYAGAGLPTLIAGVVTVLVPLTTAVSLVALAALVACLAMIRPTLAAGTVAVTPAGDRVRVLRRGEARIGRGPARTDGPRRPAPRPARRPAPDARRRRRGVRSAR